MIRFAVFTDLHYDHIPDGDRRIKEFLEIVRMKNPDFILSLGDLCYPAAENRKVIDALEQSGVPVYHTIGNHDTDQYSLEEVMDFLKIESSYYSFLIDDVKFIVLNTCYIRDGQKCVPFLKRNYDKKRTGFCRNWNRKTAIMLCFPTTAWQMILETGESQTEKQSGRCLKTERFFSA